MKLKAKYPEHIEYVAATTWDGHTGCLASVSNGRKVVLDTPKTYGGKGEGICPDELFVSSLLACLNNTFLDFQRRFELVLVSMELSGVATADFDGSGYKITGVEISGSILVGEDELDTGKRCVELMQQYCHLSRTIKDCLPIKYEIEIKEAK
ncbi:MAG: OsmC family peroxiredoxin [Candidatus Thorarchaeota archaeon]|nr:OsmC family peroxiredoxin [Candidatus Thorarchaeota archaeon]